LIKQKELSDSKTNQIALIFSDNYYITVADNRLSFARQELLPDCCHDNGLITAYGVLTPYFRGVYYSHSIVAGGFVVMS